MPGSSSTGQVSSAGTAAPGRRAGLTLALLCVAQFMVVLDLQIVNVALPSVQEALGLSTTALQWVVSAYALTFGGFLLLGGRVADLYGRRRPFSVGLLLFAAASLVGGLAQEQMLLLTACGAQGLAAALMAPAALSLITTTFTEPVERDRALGSWAAVGASGVAAGVVLGGVLTDALSRRWVFFVTVPVGPVTPALTPALVAESSTGAPTAASTCPAPCSSPGASPP